MEVKQILSEFCPIAPSLPIAKQLSSLKFPPLSSSSSSYPFIQSQNVTVPGGAFHPISIPHNKVRSSYQRNIWCSSSLNSIAEPNEGHEVRSQVTVRRKKLAVFVSGGGSNFRSIHAASKEGSLHGDVVVLVTNKSGNGLTNPPFTFISYLLYHIVIFYSSVLSLFLATFLHAL